ncbi:MAG TPA: FAD binding domain-containing protein [Stellaceae bacterium]|nr:FAD binding domain-containing protein [Stellaceae bacterium]
MKPAPFDYARPTDIAEAAAILAEGGADARVMAGGQSLGPMLNLRLAHPRVVVDITHIPDLGGVDDTADAVLLGAAVTHAAVEDGRVPDVGDRVLSTIAAGIAYRAVRNRGTVAGSLCHADPAADWVTALTALDACVITYRARGGRMIPIDIFNRGPFTTALEPGELVVAVRIPKLSRAARWGWYKVCRKPGEFSDAIGAVLIDPERNVRRAVVSATGGRPLLLRDDDASADAADRALASASNRFDAIDRQVHRVALRRAFAAARV